MDNILDTLANAFGPSEAEAASRSPAAPPDPRAELLKNLQVQQAIMRMQALAQRQQQQQAVAPIQQQLAQQRLTAGQAKAAPGPQLADILGTGGAPGAIPSSRAPDVIFRGTTPGTGTPFFTNRPEAVGQMFGPEAQKAYEAQVARAQPPTAAPGAAPTLGGAPDAQAIEKLGQFNTWADKNKIPSQIRKQMSDQLFPWAKEEKALTPEQYSKLYRMNPQTGQLESPQSEMSAPEAIKQGYKVLTPKQLETFYAADQLDAPLQQFKDILAQARGENPWALKADQFLSSHGAGMLSPLKTAGLGVEFNKSLFNVTQMFDQMVAGARGAASPQLTQLRQQALPGILNSPELRDRLMQSFEGVVDNIKRVNKAKALGIAPAPTDLKAITSFESQIGKINREVAGGVGTSAAQVSGAAPTGGQKLDQGTAMQFLRQAGGNKAKARELAKQAGYSF